MKKFVFVRFMVCLVALSTITCIKGMNQQLSYPKKNNNFDLFNALPMELLPTIFYHCYSNDPNEKTAIVATLKNIITLKKICKNFQQIFDYETAGKTFKKFNGELKEELLRGIIREKNEVALGALIDINAPHYPSKSFFIISLICAGTRLKTDTHARLVNSMLHYNDIHAISLLLNKHKIYLYMKNWKKIPLFFETRTVEMATLLHKNNINLHKANYLSSYPNVLWAAVTCNNIPSKVLKFYLKKNIAIIPRIHDRNSLLHALAIASCSEVKNVDDFLQKGKLLLAAQPTLVNALNEDKKTPLDLTYLNLAITNPLYCPTRQFITLLKEMGGKTSHELFATKHKKVKKNKTECVKKLYNLLTQ